MNHKSPHLLLRVVSKFLIPLIAIFGFYVHFHGDYGPGGGFQAGVIISASMVLYSLIFGLEACKKALPPRWIRWGMTLGVSFYVGTGILTWILGGAFLDFDVLTSDPASRAGQHIGILLVEVGVLLTVASVMMGIFYAFGSRSAEISDQDW